MQREQAAQHWQRYCGFELAGKTLAIIGLGKVGRETARLAKALDMRVIGSQRHPDSDKQPQIDALYGPDALHELLAQADFLALSVPHTPETEKLIGTRELAILP